jgi:hypothetical protein
MDAMRRAYEGVGYIVGEMALRRKVGRFDAVCAKIDLAG